MVGYSGGGYRIWDPLKDKIVSSRDVTLNESKVRAGNDTAQYQGINIEEENGHLNGKDSTELKIDTEENKTKKREKAIETKWIFKTKKNGLKKVRLVAKRFQEEPANNVYAPVARFPAIRLLISIAVSRKWEIRQLDVPSAFVNGYVDDEIYIKHLMESRTNQYKAKDLGILSEFLETMIENDGDEIKNSQIIFIIKILSKFNGIFCKGVNIPMVCDFQFDTEKSVDEKFMFRQLIGSFMNVATVNRPVISYSVCYLSRFLNKPTEQLWKAGKRVLRYLQQTQDLCLTFKPSSDYRLGCYSDSDWAGDKLDRKSLSGCVLLHRQNTISWESRKQGTVALSTAEAE
ncbi:hypothetical protein PR048_004728 [Dryococelus australis]|uniref:Reverse transcriptase Ty1/copia-type domain-containing protein n=1 Tax=Dryococelus australis TaxID=614101 RepID=A0ABQ9I857_9NEOP|nr:hypothetical protein PR048_004728 [Dryococelus australis]